MQMVFYYHMIYSPETDGQVRHCSWLQSLRIQQVIAYNDTYSVQNEVLMPCQTRLFCLLSPWECLTVSTARYQLLTSSPIRRAPPTFMMTPFPPGSTHIFIPMSVTVPDRRSRILEVVIVRRLITWVLGIWRGEGLGKGLRKGRSVYKQPETKVDGSCHS